MNADERKRLRSRAQTTKKMEQSLVYQNGGKHGPSHSDEVLDLLDDVDRLESENAALRERDIWWASLTDLINQAARQEQFQGVPNATPQLIRDAVGILWGQCAEAKIEAARLRERVAVLEKAAIFAVEHRSPRALKSLRAALDRAKEEK